MSPDLESSAVEVETAPPGTAANSASNPAPIEAAYKVCRAIARREAKNFYYAFLALPRAKHNAICAVYAFMRHADDLSDDESLARSERRSHLNAWRMAWNLAAAEERVSSADEDPVFVALKDASRRFQIPLSLLDQLVDGTTMDLDPRYDQSLTSNPGHSSSLVTYETFDELYRYCYLVASVVGLVCIRIFEYEDPQAEALAEELGVAFQLTNILRDVREDLDRGRLYLPLDDLAAHGVEPPALDVSKAAGPGPNVRALLAFETERAERFYAAGKRLMPMIHADSRPALGVLMAIYHRLLQRIRDANYNVFAARISVPAYEKFAILGRGVLGVAHSRLFSRD